MKKVRPIRIDGDVAYLTLTKGYEATIDACDIHLVSGYNWTALVVPHTVYAYRAEKSCDDKKRRTVYMHRVIMGAAEGTEVDHADCKGTNNRRSNLRIATRLENCYNRRAQKNNASGFKGVSWSESGGVWMAFISANLKQLYLGSFDTPESAHAAYVEASNMLHGNFGRAN